jgi:hypothetical protein
MNHALVEEIRIFEPIRFLSIRRNEIGANTQLESSSRVRPAAQKASGAERGAYRESGSGSANTVRVDPRMGTGISGVRLLRTRLPIRLKPVGIATYCLPPAMYVIGNPPG